MSRYRLRQAAQVGLAGLVIGLGVSGCGKKAAPAAAEVPAAVKSDENAPTGDLASATAAGGDPRLHQTFADAVLAEPPNASERPPETTLAGKSVGKTYKQVVGLWDKIAFVSASGKKLHYTATITTELGTITIELLPELAPNHVRNFIALARAGYYDGLVFERTIHENVEDSDLKRKIIEGGCPLGTGDAGYGSIGYWLKPELADGMTHDEGAVGSCHGDEEDGGACRFYINLSPAPYLDGQYTIFGKVTKGLDVAQKVLSLPVRTDAEYPEGDRPVKPVVMKRVTISVSEAEAIASK
jgi:peptidyl-prolyl cis-trans isomerase B (cyclophilin B)